MTNPSTTSTEVATRPGSSAPLMEQIAAIGVPAKLAETYVALDPESDVMEVVLENLGGDFEDLPLTMLPRMKFPTGGDTTFNVPDPSTENGSRATRRLTAVIVISQQRRAFWHSVNLTGERPACWALDGKTGEGEFGPGSARNPSGSCKTCPMAEYGTKNQLEGAPPDAAGQACKQTRLLYLLVPGAPLPMQLSVPPASLKVINKFLLELGAVSKLPFYGVEVELSLQQVTGAASPYAELICTTQRVLDADEVRVTKVYSRALKALISQANVDTVVQEVSDAEGVGAEGGGIGFDGPSSAEDATEDGFDDVSSVDEEAYDAEAASNGAGKSRASAKA